MCVWFFSLLGVPVTSVKWRIHTAANRPTPHTQSRGRRRVCLGLLGTLISPEAAGSPVRTYRPPPFAGLDPTGLLLLMDLNDGILASDFNVRDTRLLGCTGLTSAPPASSCSQSVSQSLRSFHFRLQLWGNNTVNHPAEPRWALSPVRTVPHIPPDLNAISSYMFTLVSEVFSCSLREDRQGAPSTGWGDWRCRGRRVAIESRCDCTGRARLQCKQKAATDLMLQKNRG